MGEAKGKIWLKTFTWAAAQLASQVRMHPTSTLRMFHFTHVFLPKQVFSQVYEQDMHNCLLRMAGGRVEFPNAVPTLFQ